MVSLPLTLIAAVAICRGEVLDANFDELYDIVQAHPFLAVAFYSPGCGHCRRLLPSWEDAADLLEDQDLPIRLARMDISSRGGMLAWNEFGLTRVPAVKIFVGNDVDTPLPYTGHLDARGIAAHLAMVERDRRRLLEHQERYGRLPSNNRKDANEVRVAADALSTLEPDEPDVTLVALSAISSSGSSTTEQASSLTGRFREAVTRRGLSLVLFVVEDSPKARHMISELRKAGPRLAGSNPPTGVIHVDLRSPEGAGSRKGSTRVRTKGSRKPGGDDHASPGLNAGEAKEKLAAEAGIHLHADPDLRIFLDGKPWVDGGVFRGMPTADGIVQHMEWVAMEADLAPQNLPKREAGRETTVEAAAGVLDSSSNLTADVIAAACVAQNVA